MMRFDRRSFIAASSAAGLAGLSMPAFADAGGLGALAAEKGLLFGSWARGSSLDRDQVYTAVYARECSLIVSVLEIEWDVVEPHQNAAVYGTADAICDWTLRHGMKFRPVPLVWYRHIPAWFSALPTRQEAVAALTKHVRSTARHFRGKTYSWDVINEAIKAEDGRPDGLRVSSLTNLIGPEHLDIAFETAREADPSAQLVLNEFDVELYPRPYQRKARALLENVDRLLKRNVPIDAIGLQSHLRTEDRRIFDEKGFSAFLKEISDRGLKILVTELDVVDRGSPADIPKRDADVASYMKDYLDVVLDNRASVAVIVWGLNDNDSWITKGYDPDFKRRDGLPPRPCLFDTNFQPKPSYSAVQAALRGAKRR